MGEPNLDEEITKWKAHMPILESDIFHCEVCGTTARGKNSIILHVGHDGRLERRPDTEG